MEPAPLGQPPQSLGAPPDAVGAGGAPELLDRSEEIAQAGGADYRGGVGKRAISSLTVVRSIITRRRNSPAL
jgi:hypothetical protein